MNGRSPPEHAYQRPFRITGSVRVEGAARCTAASCAAVCSGGVGGAGATESISAIDAAIIEAMDTGNLV